MAEPKHTPGPWTVEEYGDEETPALVIHKDSESRICFMATPGSMGDPEKIEADAYLIASAPDMLAALTEIASQCHNLPRSATADRIDQLARAAIAKAEPAAGGGK